MSRINLMCAHTVDTDIEVLAQRLFTALGIKDYEQRYSDNYSTGSYFLGTHDGIEFKFSLSDEADNDDLPYWINAKSASTAETFLAKIEDIVAHQLMPAGFSPIARFENFGRLDEKRVDY